MPKNKYLEQLFAKIKYEHGHSVADVAKLAGMTSQNVYHVLHNRSTSKRLTAVLQQLTGASEDTIYAASGELSPRVKKLVSEHPEAFEGLLDIFTQWADGRPKK